MPTLWFSYSYPVADPHRTPEPIRSPYDRTWHVARMLHQKATERGWQFRYVNLDDTRPYVIGKEDVVIGHLWFNDNSFMQQALEQECRLKVCMQPYTSHMVGDEALPTLHKYWQLADKLLLITGPYWWDTMDETPFAPYKAKAVRLDNSVNATLHPFLKRKWNPPGQRAAIAIGYDNPVKGMDKVAELARITGLRIGVFGAVSPALFQQVPQARLYGGVAFMPDVIQRIVDEYDFFITMGRFDANPTALHETACWGLIPFCTPQSGYWLGQPFYSLSLDDMAENWKTLDKFQHMSEYDLMRKARQQRTIQEEMYTWDNVLDTIWGEIREYLD